jgi:hypothetical protein
MANEPALCASRGTTRSRSCASEKLLLLEELNGWNASSAMMRLLDGEMGRMASRLWRSRYEDLVLVFYCSRQRRVFAGDQWAAATCCLFPGAALRIEGVADRGPKQHA